MAKQREIFVCGACGAKSMQWRGQCVSCNAWNTLEPVAVTPEKSARGRRPASLSQSPSVIALRDAAGSQNAVFSTGVAAMDRVLGGGFAPGSSILVGGEPGIGKSTLLLQLAGAVASSGKNVVYFSGEEALSQIKARAERLGVLHETLTGLSSSRIEDVFPVLEGPEPPDLLIVDSVQTVSSAQAEGLPGNVSQVRAVATELAEMCRKSETCVLFVGHVTKDGAIAGP